MSIFISRTPRPQTHGEIVQVPPPWVGFGDEALREGKTLLWFCMCAKMPQSHRYYTLKISSLQGPPMLTKIPPLSSFVP